LNFYRGENTEGIKLAVGNKATLSVFCKPVVAFEVVFKLTTELPVNCNISFFVAVAAEEF